MSRTIRIDAEALSQHMGVLTRDIGVRLAGSPAETRAAEYIAEAFASVGAVTHQESFAVSERCVDKQDLQVCMHGQWQRYPCSLFSSTPGTDGETITAPLVFFSAATDYQRTDLSHLRGKAVVHLGCHIESRDAYRRLMEADPACLLFVDVRYPGTVPLADGMFPSYTRDLGAKPTLNVAYMDAWAWQRAGASAARLCVSATGRRSRSQNIIAELPGPDANADILFCGAHHDTQAGTVGADDNASGVVSLLEMARALAPLPRRRALRFISFGAEEQLSVGSATYVRTHRADVTARGRFMFNMDSCGTLMGWTVVSGNGTPAMFETVATAFAQHDIAVLTDRGVVPYTDQFPFAVAGVPGVWLSRQNCTAGRFFHHRHDDTEERLSFDLMATNATVSAGFLAELATVETLPFETAIPASEQAAIQAFWDDLYGGWSGL